jgi:hypothetical protein
MSFKDNKGRHSAVGGNPDKQKIKIKENRQEMGKVISFYSKVGNAIVGDNNTVTVNLRKTVVVNKYPDGCIGADIIRANYVSYLVSRYQEYKRDDVGPVEMIYPIFHSNLKSKFKVGKTRTIYHIPINRFEEVIEYIQMRINGTRLAKINKGKSQFRNYQSFGEYKTNQTF